MDGFQKPVNPAFGRWSANQQKAGRNRSGQKGKGMEGNERSGIPYREAPAPEEHASRNARMGTVFRNEQRDVPVRIIQESVPGKQITMAHIISSPDPIMYQKLGLDPKVDYHNAAIGIMAITPYETAIIAADLCMKFSAVSLGFLDRFSGTLIVTGLISDVEAGFERVLDYTSRDMDYTVCGITAT